MSVLIKGIDMPKDGGLLCVNIFPDGKVCINLDLECKRIATAVPVPPHGRLIDADALRRAMYHEAFETDSPMQKWDSGCWIRYKMFESLEENAPTIIKAEEGVEKNG